MEVQDDAGVLSRAFDCGVERDTGTATARENLHHPGAGYLLTATHCVGDVPQGRPLRGREPHRSDGY
jgi:hypothetical protein